MSDSPSDADATPWAAGDPARAFIKRGWDPIPLYGVNDDGICVCRDAASCKSPGKHPVQSGWQSRDRMTIQETYDHWDTETQPRNTGIRTGDPSKVWALDVDPKNGGREGLAALVRDIGPLPVTRTHATGSGGEHFLFKLPADFEVTNSRRGLANYAGLDVRGNGGFIVMPPSVSGVGPYGVKSDADPAPTPAALADLLRPEEHSEIVLTEADGVAYGDLSPEQQVIVDKYLQSARDGEIARLDAMREAAQADLSTYRGEPWNPTTYEVACNLLELAQSPWANYGLEDVKRDLTEHAPTDRGFTQTDVMGRLRSAENKVRGQARPAPDGIIDTWALLTEGIESRGGSSNPSKRVAVAAEHRNRPSTWPVRPSLNWAGTSRALAERIVDNFVPEVDGIPILAVVQGQWHYWDGIAWIAVPLTEVTDFASNILALATEPPEKDSDGKPEKPRATSTAGRVVNDLVNSGLAPELRLHAEPGQRIGGSDKERMVGLANGVLAIAPSGDYIFTPSSPQFFNVTAGRYDYDPAATCPRWEAWLEQTFAHDPQAIPALQEWFGAFLLASPDKVQKVFWLIGPKRSGKGTIQGVARRLVGGAASTALRSFASQFGRENLIGHSLAIIDDSRDPRRDEADAVMEFLLSYSTGVELTIPRKHRPDWTGVLRQSLLAASNTPPRLADEGQAMATRMEVIQTRISMLGHEDVYLQDRLAEELPGILNWALVGLRRLVANGFRFTQGEAAPRIRADVEASGTGAGAFVVDLVMDGGQVANEDLRRAAEWWARKDSESGNAPHAKAIKSAIQHAYPDARDRQQVPRDGRPRAMGWKGISLRCTRCEGQAVEVSEKHGPLCQEHLASIDFFGGVS
jgi:putative DNA primase/helicase